MVAPQLIVHFIICCLRWDLLHRDFSWKRIQRRLAGDDESTLLGSAHVPRKQIYDKIAFIIHEGGGGSTVQ